MSSLSRSSLSLVDETIDKAFFPLKRGLCQVCLGEASTNFSPLIGTQSRRVVEQTFSFKLPPLTKDSSICASCLDLVNTLLPQDVDPLLGAVEPSLFDLETHAQSWEGAVPLAQTLGVGSVSSVVGGQDSVSEPDRKQAKQVESIGQETNAPPPLTRDDFSNSRSGPVDFGSRLSSQPIQTSIPPPPRPISRPTTHRPKTEQKPLLSSDQLAKTSSRTGMTIAEEIKDGEFRLQEAMKVGGGPGDPITLEGFIKTVMSLKVPALREALNARNENTKGKKVELQARLITHHFGEGHIPEEMQKKILAVEAKRNANQRKNKSLSSSSSALLSVKRPRTQSVGVSNAHTIKAVTHSSRSSIPMPRHGGVLLGVGQQAAAKEPASLGQRLPVLPTPPNNILAAWEQPTSANGHQFDPTPVLQHHLGMTPQDVLRSSAPPLYTSMYGQHNDTFN